LKHALCDIGKFIREFGKLQKQWRRCPNNKVPLGCLQLADWELAFRSNSGCTPIIKVSDFDKAADRLWRFVEKEQTSVGA